MPGTMSVLVVSGDGGTADELKELLRELDSTIYTAASMVEADAIARRHPLKVVIADVRRGRSNPAGILNRLRRLTDAPVLMLTAGNSDLAGHCLESGAADCLTWPVTSRELLARIRLCIGNGNGHGRLEIDHHNRTVAFDGKDIELADREFELLAFMAASPGVAFTSDQLLDTVWGSSRDWQSISTIREHIYRLRHKLEVDPANPELIVTVRGHGYRLDI